MLQRPCQAASRVRCGKRAPGVAARLSRTGAKRQAGAGLSNRRIIRGPADPPDAWAAWGDPLRLVLVSAGTTLDICAGPGGATAILIAVSPVRPRCGGALTASAVLQGQQHRDGSDPAGHCERNRPDREEDATSLRQHRRNQSPPAWTTAPCRWSPTPPPPGPLHSTQPLLEVRVPIHAEMLAKATTF